MAASATRDRLPRAFSWRRAIVFSLALWLVMLGVDIVKDSIAAWLLERPIGWTLVRQSAMWWPNFIVLTPLVLWLAYRVPAGPGRWGRAALAHVPGAIVFALTHLLLCRLVVMYYFNAMRWDVFTRTFKTSFSSFFLFDVMVYSALVAGYWAWDYYQRYRDRELAAAEAEKLAATARFDALRWQLNPHFLFNSLNAVAGLVRSGDSKGGVDMLARISALLRSTLDDANATDVSLARELELVQLYTSIEQVRFGDRLTIEMTVDDDLLDATVPALILQPLVENAVRHGVSATSEPVRVDVAAARSADGLRLTVRDNGSGFSPETVREGVGLSNTRERLAHRFGDSARLELASPGAGGGEVTLVMPYEPHQEAA